MCYWVGPRDFIVSMRHGRGFLFLHAPWSRICLRFCMRPGPDVFVWCVFACALIAGLFFVFGRPCLAAQEPYWCAPKTRVTHAWGPCRLRVGVLCGGFGYRWLEPKSYEWQLSAINLAFRRCGINSQSGQSTFYNLEINSQSRQSTFYNLEIISQNKDSTFYNLEINYSNIFSLIP